MLHSWSTCFSSIHRHLLTALVTHLGGTVLITLAFEVLWTILEHPATKQLGTRIMSTIARRANPRRRTSRRQRRDRHRR